MWTRANAVQTVGRVYTARAETGQTEWRPRGRRRCADNNVYNNIVLVFYYIARNGGCENPYEERRRFMETIAFFQDRITLYPTSVAVTTRGYPRLPVWTLDRKIRKYVKRDSAERHRYLFCMTFCDCWAFKYSVLCHGRAVESSIFWTPIRVNGMHLFILIVF